MFCLKQELIDDMPLDTRVVVIQADTTPDTLPMNGENVKTWGGRYLGAHIKFAPGSIVHCVDTGKNHVMNETATAWNVDGGE